MNSPAGVSVSVSVNAAAAAAAVPMGGYTMTSVPALFEGSSGRSGSHASGQATPGRPAPQPPERVEATPSLQASGDPAPSPPPARPRPLASPRSRAIQSLSEHKRSPPRGEQRAARLPRFDSWTSPVSARRGRAAFSPRAEARGGLGDRRADPEQVIARVRASRTCNGPAHTLPFATTARDGCDPRGACSQAASEEPGRCSFYASLSVRRRRV
jgi:hypothetical protein